MKSKNSRHVIRLDSDKCKNLTEYDQVCLDMRTSELGKILKIKELTD
jgi:hypothetical protein